MRFHRSENCRWVTILGHREPPNTFTLLNSLPNQYRSRGLPTLPRCCAAALLKQAETTLVASELNCLFADHISTRAKCSSPLQIASFLRACAGNELKELGESPIVARANLTPDALANGA